MKTWRKGQQFWRGYARTYDGGSTYFPEIRAGFVDRRNDDGTYRARMLGTMPGAEHKRFPGGWVAFSLDPDLLCKTPEEALHQAKFAVPQTKKKSKEKKAA